MSELRDERREKIEEAALQRFMHYGHSKTSMQEIADDLGISKASLYYYFPDKHALYLSVLKRVGYGYFESLRKETAKLSGPDSFRHIGIINKEYLKRFYRLGLFDVLSNRQELRKDDEFHEARKEHINIIIGMLNKGIETGEWKLDNVSEMAELFLETMAGIRLGVIEFSANKPVIDETLLELIAHKQQMLTEVFIRGLKS